MRSRALVLVLLFCAAATAQEPSKRDLTELSLEELMDVEVTSVAKRQQRLADAPQAIYVITQEDIRRSGATTIAEVLRLAPGLNVAQIDANKWAISSRGFNGRFANKLLVLIDGRTVYTPLFSGVFWDVQDTTLADIDRIEVIRGPGAALWGANAVNGVINIITKDAAATQGGLVSAGAGSHQRAFGTVRYGGELSEGTYYRVAAKWFDRDEFAPVDATPANDAWNAARGSFRLDHAIATHDSLMLQGEYYDGDYGDVVAVPTLAPPYSRDLVSTAEFSGGHVLGHWQHGFASGGDLALQIYYDRTERADRVHRETRDTFDLDFQHTLRLTERQLMIWGTGFRRTEDDITGVIVFDPRERSDDLWSAFVQDEISLRSDAVRVTLGSKLEWNDYTGFELQPSVRLLWRPRGAHSVWASASRAVRTPSRFEHDATIDASVTPNLGPLPVLLQLRGSDRYESEELLSYELGTRAQLAPGLSVDVAAFYTDFERMRTFEPGTPELGRSLPPHFVVPIVPSNNMTGESHGIETAASWNVTDHWRLTLTHSWLEVELHPAPTSGDTAARDPEGDSPDHQFHLRSYLDLPANFKLDALFFYVGELPNQEIAEYERVDLRVAWNPMPPLEVSVVIQNLTDDEHPEFGTSVLVSPTLVERSVYGKVTWRF